jgi:hypothetical protein
MRMVDMKSFLKWSKLPIRQNSLLERVIKKRSMALLVWCLAPSCSNLAKLTGMSYPVRKGANSSLSRLKQTSEVTLLSLNTGPNITTLDNTHHTVIAFGCSRLEMTSLGFSQAQNRFHVTTQLEVCFIGDPWDQDTQVVSQWRSIRPRKSAKSRYWLTHLHLVRKQEFISTNFPCGADWDPNLLC